MYQSLQHAKEKSDRGIFLLISVLVLAASTIAALWFVYLPDAPHTEQGTFSADDFPTALSFLSF